MPKQSRANVRSQFTGGTVRYAEAPGTEMDLRPSVTDLREGMLEAIAKLPALPRQGDIRKRPTPTTDRRHDVTTMTSKPWKRPRLALGA